MLDGLYSAASGMLGQQGRIDAISNDLANVNTVGYKSVRFHFGDMLYQRMGNNRAMANGSQVGAGVRGSVIDRSLTQGTVERTDQPFDMAIQGTGYFQVRTADGRVALTRDGSFRADSQGRLVSARGETLVPEVRIPRNVDPGKVSISQDGVVRVGEDGRALGRVVIVNVAAPQRLSNLGENLYGVTAQSGAAQAAPAGSSIQQGALESSNVEVTQAFSDLIESQRAYELSSRAVRTWDELLQTANQIRR